MFRCCAWRVLKRGCMPIIDINIPPSSIEIDDLYDVYNQKSYASYVLFRNLYDFPERVSEPLKFATYLNLFSRPKFYVGYEQYESISLKFCEYLKLIRADFSLLPTAKILSLGDVVSNEISFLHHKYGRKKNTWYFKEAYLKNTCHFERGGYSGWSESVLSDSPFSLCDDDLIYYQSLRDGYSKNQMSKYNQASIEIGNEFDVSEFIFIPLQVDSDSVQAHNNFRSYWDVLLKIVEYCIDHNINVVLKRHPMCTSSSFDGFYSKIKDNNLVRFSNASVYSLIDKCTAVCTMNSGVGYEALLAGRKVFTFGLSDYSSLTIQIKNESDIPKLLDYKTSFDSDLIKVGMMRLIKRYQVNFDDAESFFRVVLRALALREIHNQGWADPYSPSK